MTYDVTPRFLLGQLTATPEALALLEKLGLEPTDVIRRHVTCDWGDVCEDDGRANDVALEQDSRILSVYRLADDAVIWIITEADRSSTTLLLPEEY